MKRFLRAEIHEAVQTIRDAINLVRTSHGVLRVLFIFFFNPFMLLGFILTQFFISLLAEIRDHFQSPPVIEGKSCHVRTDWLERRVTKEEAESDNKCYPGRPRIDGIPFGYCNAYWRALIDFMLETDELWYYDSHHELHPEWGYVVVRNGQPVARIQTSLDW
jgi:hypothetical protein